MSISIRVLFYLNDNLVIIASNDDTISTLTINKKSFTNFLIRDFLILRSRLTQADRDITRSQVREIVQRHTSIESRDDFFDLLDLMTLVVKARNEQEVYESKNYKKTMIDNYRKIDWELIIDNELQSHQLTKIWDLIKLSFNFNVLSDRWMFTLKRETNDKIIRYKTRWVVRDNEQREEDYDETFVTIMKLMSYKVIFALVVVND